MKKGKEKTNTSKITTKETKKQQAKERSNVRKPMNKKVVIPVAILLIIILIGTIVVYAFSKNTSNVSGATLQEAKTRNIELVDNEHMHVETDASGDKVPVPKGYVGSKATGENEIDSGYVIYEGEEEVTDSNVADAQKNRNQYVWIPVPDISKFYGTDANGKKWGKIYNFSTSTSSSYDQTTGTAPNNWRESNGVMSITNKTGSYREPDVVPGYTSGSSGYRYDMDSRMKTLGLGASTTHEYLIQLEQEFNRMIASVEKYGGFYIGRYETGDLSKENPVIKKGNTDINYQTWYNMYKRCKNLKGSNTNVETGMAWGNQYDRTLMWLIEMNAKNSSLGKTKAEICSDSTSWGNYKNATFEYTTSSGGTATKQQNNSTRIPTGSSDYTKANNIYDLAGNVYDWTMEAYNCNFRVLRGGHYYYLGSVSPARNRYDYYPTTSNYVYGCRAALYIK